MHVMLRQHANQKRADHVDSQRPYGKRNATRALNQSSDEKSKNTAHSATNRDPDQHRGKLMTAVPLCSGPVLADDPVMLFLHDGSTR